MLHTSKVTRWHADAYKQLLDSANCMKNLKARLRLYFFMTLCLVTLSPMWAPSVVFAVQLESPKCHQRPGGRYLLDRAISWDDGNTEQTGYDKGGAVQSFVATDCEFERIPQRPAINNSTGASNITATTALLNGKVISTGCPPETVDPTPATVHIYWGTADGGNALAKWEHDVNLGTQPTAVFGAYMSGLTANTTYYYRSFIRNSAGEAWAASSASFTTTDLVNSRFSADTRYTSIQ